MTKHRKFICIMTAVNLLIAAVFLICMLRVSDMHRSINAVDTDFEYEEKNGITTLSLADGGRAELRFSKDGVSIRDSHLLDSPGNIAEMLRFVRYYAEREGYEITRSNTELIGEYRLHTILYNLGYEKESTGTTNWDFSDDPRWYGNTASRVIGFCGL